ncbi:tyrosine-type recombinase/integrase [Guptibacillus hwajinpoensis]|uniref:tyrosine-type recombinase/integrase n=1 Tax=Guptibacillus hwajinpoensis TaxID=208199 RepID=UPI003736DFF9
MSRRKNDLSSEELSFLNDSKQTQVIDFKTALSSFLEDCEIRNLRPQTIQYYRNELSLYYKLLREQDIDASPSEITKDIIKRNIILYMKDTKKLQVVTINTRLRAIRAFFNYLYREKHIKHNPVKDIKLLKDRRKVVETFTLDQLNKLFQQPDLRTFIGVRDYSYMLLLLETGIRVSELEGVCIQDIRWSDSTLHIRNTKSYKERLVPIQKQMKDQLKKYIQIRGVLSTDALFITLEGEPMTKRQFQNRVTHHGKKANLTGVRCSCHTFRHTFAKMAVKQGAGIFELQSILGHTSMEMVRIYVNLFSGDVTEKHKNFSPLKNIKPRL